MDKKVIKYLLLMSDHMVSCYGFIRWQMNPETWKYYYSSTTPPEPLFDRDFTLHEYLDAFKLINMPVRPQCNVGVNGRMYDPVIARFLSPDPIIQFPESSQSYNSYSYVLNNPLKYTDPSGFALDWFKNEITGDVYYNSTYKEGDEDKIGGDGWTYLGKNGMFSDNTVAKAPVLSDLEVLFKDQTPIVRHFSESGNGAFTVEAVLRGKNASGFMSGQGFELKPKLSYERVRFDHPVNTLIPSGGSVSIENLSGQRMVELRTYAPMNSSVRWNTTHFKTVTNMGSSSTVYTKTNYSYYINNKAGSIMKKIGIILGAYNGDSKGGADDVKNVYKWEDITDPELRKLKGK